MENNEHAKAENEGFFFFFNLNYLYKFKRKIGNGVKSEKGSLLKGNKQETKSKHLKEDFWWFMGKMQF